MSSPSDSDSPSPADPAREPHAPIENPPEASAGNPPGESRRPAIRIGTQRYGVKAPPAVAKPVIGPAPVARREDEAETESEPPAEPVASSASAAESAAPESSAAESGLHESQAGQPSAPSDRPRDKSRKPQSKKPSIPVYETRHERTVELPNLRAGLSEDLELEYMEALGGQSLDDIIAGESAGPAAELPPETRRQGTVVAIHRDDVFFDIGARQQGVTQLKNFANPPEPGAKFDVIVSRFDATEGLYELILPGGAVDVGDWSEVAEGMIVEARVTGHNKGGLECEVSRLRGFIPASQVSMYRVEDLSEFVDQKFACVITEANPEKRNLVLSRRAVLEREKAEAKESMLASLEVGQTREGTVRSLQAFGAFVDLGGVDGLVHISQLSWDRLKHADEVLEVGQKIKVKIQKIDPQTGKIGLGFRDLSENPWEHAARDYPVRAAVKGRVSRIMEFGAFVRLGPGVEGLIHISELSHKRVFRVTDVVTEGQDVEVMVLSVDTEQQRISLSLKALEARAAPVKAEEEPEEAPAPAPVVKKRQQPLKGGTGGPATGERFGLKW